MYIKPNQLAYHKKIRNNYYKLIKDPCCLLNTRCSIAEHTMAKVTFIDPIKSVSDKLSKKHHVVHCIRQAATNNPEMIKNPQFTQWKDPNREIKQTAAQMAWTQKFGQISNATRARLIDASHMNADRAAFANQSEYKTLYSFVWNLVREEME